MNPFFQVLRNIQIIFIFAAIISSTVNIQAAQVKLKVEAAQPYILANKKQKTYLKVGLTGFEISDKNKRTPVNIAIVLDRSGSMHGQKLSRAKEAAIMAINRLGANDIVSILTYDDVVTVNVPATKVYNKTMINLAINEIHSGGSTALFAGVSKGAEEIRKFKSINRVNRIILLSDGLANVGPSSAGALGDLGASLAKEGISVTTIGLGLGYNEDLMVQLARNSDGNHAFVEHPNDLIRIFDLEFGDVLSVVAQEIEIHINCHNGAVPIRVLGRDAVISGKSIRLRLNQIYSNQEKYVLLELIPPVGKNQQKKKLVTVIVKYSNMLLKHSESINDDITISYTNSAELVNKSINKGVMVPTVLQIATEKSKKAVLLRDKGKKEEAKRILNENAAFLKQKAKTYNAPALNSYGEKAMEDAAGIGKDDWNETRKKMRKDQSSIEMQQSY